MGLLSDEEQVKQMIYGLNMLGGGQGVSPYGYRHDSIGVKGKGFMGPLSGQSGISTEISSSDDKGDFPLIVPTLSTEQLKHLLSNNPPTDEIYKKAIEYANSRRESGKSPFYDGQGLYYPVPKY